MHQSLGRISKTPAVTVSVPEEVITVLLDRHAACDWGDLYPFDRPTNDALYSKRQPGRLFSSYDTPKHGTIRVITENLQGEGNGLRATVLFPNDY